MGSFPSKGRFGFSRSSTAEEVTAGITGASSGIGLETARVLALRGVHVVMAVRNVPAGRSAREGIGSKIPGARVEVLELDLSSMASVRRFAAEFEALNLPLNILINNAGVLTKHVTRSHDGLELHFETTSIWENERLLLLPSAVKSLFHNIQNPSGSNTIINGFMAYCESKLANILHSTELSRILKEEGTNISANAVHPGVIVTNLSRNLPIVNALINCFGRIFGTDIEQGAATTCYVALHPQVNGLSGKFFDKCTIAKPSSKASDPELAKKLWQFSLHLVSS